MAKISKDVNSRDDSSSSSSSNGSSNGLSNGFSSHNKVKKSTDDEMQSLLAKLKELVPNIPRNKKLSKLEIIQYVIDYIFDLQFALESHPISSNNSSHMSSSPSSPSNRQPLAIKWV